MAHEKAGTLRGDMMKKSILMVVFWSLVMLLSAAVGIATVKMEDHAGAVCRVVISLTEEGEYHISESGGGLAISFSDFDTSTKARIYAESSKLITAIKQDNEVLQLLISKPYRYETMNFDYPRRLVVDVFSASPSKAERLTIGAFYSEMGKFNSADRSYSALHADYPKDAQILYHWALLLQKRRSSRALEVLAKIPETSAYYERGQKLLARLSGEDLPQPVAPKAETPAPPIVEAAPEALAVQDSSSVPLAPQVVKDAKPAPVAPKITVKKAANPYMLQIALLIGLLVLLAVVLYYLFTGKRQPKIDLLADDLPDPVEEEASDRTMRRMVSKLLDDGWTHKEIAREMKISTAKVERLIHFRHVDSSPEDDK